LSRKETSTRSLSSRRNKLEQNSFQTGAKNKRSKISDEEAPPEGQTIENEQQQFEKKVLLQALTFQRELQDMRRMRVTFAKAELRRAMERQVIGSSGYGRFLCSHYNPGSSFISALNSLSQKLESKSREKKRLEKELRKREDEKNTPEEPPTTNVEKQEEVDVVMEDTKQEPKEEEKQVVDTVKEKDLINEEDLPQLNKQEDVKMEEQNKPKDHQIKTESSKAKTSKQKNSKDSDVKLKTDAKASNKSKPIEEPAETKSNPTTGNLETKNTVTKKVSETQPEILHDDVDLAELEKTVSMDNHNKMVHDILNQNNTRISSGKKKNQLNKQSSTKSKKSNKEQTATDLQNDDGDVNKQPKEPGAKRTKKSEAKTQENEKEENPADDEDEKEKEVREKPPKIEKLKPKKVKEPKPKKEKVEKPKDTIKKMKPAKAKYQGSVIKKKFAPKKIGAPDRLTKKESDSSGFQVVAQIESDDEKNTPQHKAEITVITEPIDTDKEENSLSEKEEEEKSETKVEGFNDDINDINPPTLTDVQNE